MAAGDEHAPHACSEQCHNRGKDRVIGNIRFRSTVDPAGGKHRITTLLTNSPFVVLSSYPVPLIREIGESMFGRLTLPPNIDSVSTMS